MTTGIVSLRLYISDLELIRELEDLIKKDVGVRTSRSAILRRAVHVGLTAMISEMKNQ